MADVLIVCVREDEPQAKALAEMFEAAGFSIGGAPSNDASLRSSGAGVVVWSQASIRSRPFLDAAQRVINANKAIVASLIEPPPPSSIGDSPAFDLSHWDGDPNDPSLDPLFFAVDRMVNSARVGAPAAQDEYEPTAPAPMQQRAAPRPAPAPAPQPTFRAPPPAAPAPAADPLGTEAEHWRAIRDSRNPTDFMDYLARYGAQGAFAEVAELRLKQLTAEAPQRPAPPARPAPEPRAEAPMRREAAPPPRRPDPPPRRAEAPPPPRRAEAPPPRRMPPPDRTYDRADLREPPATGGGALRAFILIALLGGAALAGGLYFGGGLGDQANAPQEQTQDLGSSAPLDVPSEVPLEPTSAETLDEPPARPIQVANRVEAPAQTPPREREPTPPPAATNTDSTPRSGPVSLTPGSTSTVSQTPSTGSQSTIVPLSPPQTAPTQVSTTPTRPPEPRAAPPGTVSWAQRPSARRISDLYPQRALREGIGGRVTMDCVVLSSLGVNCTIASESPAGEGFGRAALSASSSYRASPTLSNGQSAVGSRTRIAVSFQAPQ